MQLDSPLDIREQAFRWAEIGAVGKATRSLQEVLQSAPDDHEVLRWLAMHVRGADEADRYFRRLEALVSLNVNECVQWARQLASNRRFSQARVQIARAVPLASTPDDKLAVAQALFFIPATDVTSVVVNLVGDLDGAKDPRVADVLVHALERSPSEVALDQLAPLVVNFAPRAGSQIGINAATAFVERGRVPEAHQVWQELSRPELGQDPWPLVRYLITGGRIAFELDDVRRAADLYGAALALWPEDIASDQPFGVRTAGFVRYDYCNALLESGRFSQALAEADVWAEVDDSLRRTAESIEEDVDNSEASRLSLLRSMVRAQAYESLGNHRATYETLFVARRELEAMNAPEAISAITNMRLSLDSLLGIDPQAELRKIESTAVVTDQLETRGTALLRVDDNETLHRAYRDDVQVRLDVYRQWADRDESFAATAGDFVRRELAGWDSNRDPSFAALLALYAGQPSRARELLAAIKRDNWRDDLLRAVVEFELGHSRVAAKHCDAVLARRPFDIEVELLRAEIERELHGPAAARVLAEEIVQRRPTNVDAQIFLADCCYDLGRDPEKGEGARVDVALLTESARRYQTAVVLSDTLREFLRAGGGGDPGSLGSRWLGAKSYQRAVRRGAMSAVRASVLLEKRKLPQDNELNKIRSGLVRAIDDLPLQRQLNRSIKQNLWARGRRWLRNTGLWVGVGGALLVVASMWIPAIPKLWGADNTLLFLGIFVALALFPTISEISLPGGLGLKRQVLPAEEADLQPSELQRALSPLSRRVIPSSAQVATRRTPPKGQAAAGAAAGADPNAKEGADELGDDDKPR
jgi:tetratricopeptide (TPR) repeat protein